MSAEHQRQMNELREFREQVKDFQARLRNYPEDVPPEGPRGVMWSPVKDNRAAVDSALTTLLGAMGVQEVYLTAKVGS
jgi:hypothetical protein